MKTRILFLLAGATLVTAQKIDLKLGLWESTTKTETSGMPAMPSVDMSKMPPEMRDRMEAMMKARQAAAPQAHTSRNCVTQEDLDKSLFKQENEREATCKRTVISSSATSQHVKIECTGKQKMTGEATFTAQSRESVNGVIKLTMGDGPNPMIINSNVTSKWLGPACGDVK